MPKWGRNPGPPRLLRFQGIRFSKSPFPLPMGNFPKVKPTWLWNFSRKRFQGQRAILARCQIGSGDPKGDFHQSHRRVHAIFWFGAFLLIGRKVGEQAGDFVDTAWGLGGGHWAGRGLWRQILGPYCCPTNRRPYGFDWEDWGRMDALEVLEVAQKPC